MLHRELRGVTAAIAAVLLLAGCSSPEERFADYMEHADELAERGEAEAAILEYRSALKLFPEDVDVNERLAIQLTRRGNPSAVVYLEEAIRLAPERVDLKTQLAHLLLALGRRSEAEQLITASLAAHPGTAAVYSAQAELLLFKAETDGALAAAEKATALDPDDASVWVQLGRVHVGRVREAMIRNDQPPDEWYEAAVAAFDRAEATSGGLVSARLEKAAALGMREETRQQSVEAYTAAIALADEQGQPAVQMEAAAAAEAFAEAVGIVELQRRAVRHMIEVDDGRLDLWQKLAELGDAGNDSRLEVYSELLERRPDDPEAHVMYASFLISRGEERAAMRHMREVIANSPDSPEAWELLIRLQLTLKRYAKARATFVRMTDEFPDSPITRRTEARIALAEGRNADALPILRAHGAASKQFESQRLLAIAEYRNGNNANAAAAIERALAMEPQFASDAMRLKAKIHHDSREWGETLRTLTILARRGERMTQREQVMRARAFYETGQPAKGRGVLVDVLRRPRAIPWSAVEYAKREGDDDAYQAARYLLRALEQQPSNPDVVEALVGLDLDAGRVDAALARLDTAIETGRARPETLLLRAYVFTKLNELDRAESDALRAFEADTQLEGAVDLIYAIYRAQGRLDEARESFEEADKAGVLHAGARLLLGRIYLQQGDRKKAVETFERILRQNPELSAAKNDLAYLLADENRDLDRALNLAEEAQQSMSTDPNAADTVGYVYYRRGLHEAALQQFHYALELNRDRRNHLEPTLHYHLGLALDALERGDEATASFRRALQLDSNFPDAEDARRRIEAKGQTSPAAPRPS